MAQSLRTSGKEVSPHWLTLQNKIKGALAVDVLNRILEGEEVNPQQERAALFLVNKLLPSLQAVAVQIQTDRPQSKEDIAALLTTTGLKPDQVWSALMGNRTKERVGREIIEHDPGDPEGAPTPADGA